MVLGGEFMITIQQMGKLRHKAFRPLAQCPPDTGLESQGLNPILSHLEEPICPITLCHLRVAVLGGKNEHGQKTGAEEHPALELGSLSLSAGPPQ